MCQYLLHMHLQSTAVVLPSLVLYSRDNAVMTTCPSLKLLLSHDFGAGALTLMIIQT